jgi:hypothetical protein
MNAIIREIAVFSWEEGTGCVTRSWRPWQTATDPKLTAEVFVIVLSPYVNLRAVSCAFIQIRAKKWKNDRRKKEKIVRRRKKGKPS